MPKSVMLPGAMKSAKVLRKKRKDLSVLAKTPRLNRFLEHLKMKVKIKTLA